MQRESAGLAIPGLRALRGYRREWLPKDVVAGLVLTALLVPQGMAYAELAGLPPITGLYTSILCLLGYALFGPSRILVLGPDSSLGPMIAATILPLVAAGGDPERGGRARLGARADGRGLMIARRRREARLRRRPASPSRRSIGYMNGLAADDPGRPAAQAVRVLGRRRRLHRRGCAGSSRASPTARRSGAALAIGAGRASLLILGAAAAGCPKVPGVLVAVVLAIAAAAVFDLAEHGVSLVGALPQGFPPLHHPRRRARPTSAAAGRRRARHRARLAHRHDLHGVGVRRPHRPGGRRQRRR